MFLYSSLMFIIPLNYYLNNSDAGTFYNINPHKAISIHVCGLYRFCNVRFLEGFSVTNFSNNNSILLDISMFNIVIFIIQNGIGFTILYAPPPIFIIPPFIILSTLIFVYRQGALVFTCFMLLLFRL